MDGTVKYINLRTGPGGSGSLPDGTESGQVLQWNGSAWVAVSAAVPFNALFGPYSANGSMASAVAGMCKLVSITLQNTSAYPVQIVISTTGGTAYELVNDLIPAGELYTVTVNMPFAVTSNLSITSPDWNGATVRLSLHQHKIF